MDKIIYRIFEPDIFYPENGKVVVPYRARKFGKNVKFEEVYFSEVLPFSTKGLKRHHKLFTRLFPISGSCIVGITKSLAQNQFKKISLSHFRPKILEIAPMHWFYLKNMSDQTCVLMNAIEKPSDDVENADIKDLNL